MRVNNLIRPNRLYRALAIFFLIFTAIDLTFPSLCQADEPTDPCATAVQPDASKTDNHFVGLSDPSAPTNSPAEHSEFEEDCFCCCSHIIPSPHIGVAESFRQPRVAPATLASLPAAPPHNTYHPPRRFQF